MTPDSFLAAVVYLIVSITTPTAPLKVEVYALEKCPDLKQTKAELDKLVKERKVDHYEVACIPGPAYVPPKEGDPA